MKYKLLKDLPRAKAGTEVYLEIKWVEKSNAITSLEGEVFAWIAEKDIPEWLEPIMEKKKYDDLDYGDKVWYICDDGSINSTIYNAYNDYTRSETFLTREEAEDEHKRREWAVRPDRYIPKNGDTYWEYSTYSEKPVWDYYGRASNGALSVNLGLVFKTKKECQDAIDNHDLIRLFYTIR